MVEQHLFLAIDRIRETQILHGALLQKLGDGQARIETLLRVPGHHGHGILSTAMSFASGKKVIQWLIIAMVALATMKGYDLVDLLKILVTVL